MKYSGPFATWPLFSKLSNNLSIKKASPVSSILKITVIIIALSLITGCYNFYKVSTTAYPQPGSISPLIDMHRTFVIHSGTSAFLINNIRFERDSVFGNYVGIYELPYNKISYPAENSSNRYLKKKGDARILNEVHLYVQDIDTILLPGATKNSFALKDIFRLDIYDQDRFRTAMSWALGGLICIFGIPIVFFLLLLATGASCPFIYVNTGDGFALAGEIYSGAVYAPIERNDYLALPRLVSEDGSYRLKISNELKETQFTNLAELIVIDHPQKSEVLIDKYGNYQTATEVISPDYATNLAGEDILRFIKDKDSISYSGIPSNYDIPLTDGIIMTFELPEGASSGKIFLRARNSPWLDYVYKNSHDLFGGSYDKWTRRQNKSDKEELLAWSLSQKIPLSVYIEKNGQWVFCDYFNMAGPVALKNDVISVDLTGIAMGPLKVKLESGTCFWDIDYAGIDFSENIPVGLKSVKVEKAITNEEMDVTDLLKYDDLKYYVQPEPTNRADLSFPVPPLTNSKRTVILHSKGYYQIMSEGKGLPKIHKLKTIQKPGQFLEYSRQLMRAAIDNNGRYKNETGSF